MLPEAKKRKTNLWPPLFLTRLLYFNKWHHDPTLVERSAFIKVRYTDLDNAQNELAASKDYAALLAHEIDHLDGTLYIDYI